MLNAVGKAQNILLLGGTSDIGLAIVQEFLSHGPARVTLAARLDSPRLDAAVRQVEQAGASAVEVIDFDAADTDSHPEVIDAAFANGDVDLAIVAFGTLGDAEELWQNQEKAVESAQINYTGAVSVGVLLGQKFKEQGHGTIVALSSVAGVKVRRSNFVRLHQSRFRWFLHPAGRSTARQWCPRPCGSPRSGTHKDECRRERGSLDGGPPAGS